MGQLPVDHTISQVHSLNGLHSLTCSEIIKRGETADTMKLSIYELRRAGRWPQRAAFISLLQLAERAGPDGIGMS